MTFSGHDDSTINIGLGLLLLLLLLRSCERSAAGIRSLAKLGLVTFSAIEPAN